jgi:hypothetical protein
MFECCHSGENKPAGHSLVEERGMRFLLILGWSLMMAMAAMPAAAASLDSGGNAKFSGRALSSRSPAPRRTDNRAPQPGAGETERNGMSIDERRQLRRDIENAGREIYRKPERGRRGGGRSGRR